MTGWPRSMACASDERCRAHRVDLFYVETWRCVRHQILLKTLAAVIRIVMRIAVSCYVSG